MIALAAGMACNKFWCVPEIFTSVYPDIYGKT